MKKNETVLVVDATYGVKVKEGQRVALGQEVGRDAETGETVTSPLAGIVKKIAFGAGEHAFEIVIEICKGTIDDA